ncbi:MAG TPA: hypothetical protein VFE85_08265 [Woeseiaceae bacterium]|nr:hypothetical protein [Woeseiaceae bacterium]
MSEWLALMLEEIERKKQEERDAREEARRRDSEARRGPPAPQEK